ncbi:MAG: hypothetical protein ACK5M7_08980 [Draconibacterium sp.]
MKTNDSGEKHFFWKVNGSNKVLNNPDENTIAFLKEINGKTTIKELIDLWENNFSTRKKAQEEICKMFRKLFELDMVQIIYDYNIQLGKKPFNN